MGFRALRVINEDRVAPGGGFGRHSHRDMEILTVVLQGGLAHEDSTGHASTLRRGDVQRMSAGTGVVHSEMNASATEPVHFLQIWIEPGEPGIAPGYEERRFDWLERPGRLVALAAPGGRDGALTIHQDAAMLGARLRSREGIVRALAGDRHAWVQVLEGAVQLNGLPLSAGDGAAASGESELVLQAESDATVLVFDLA
jgi:redox-sensitive bicupin YhaK (pirin superfamily)